MRLRLPCIACGVASVLVCGKKVRANEDDHNETTKRGVSRSATSVYSEVGRGDALIAVGDHRLDVITEGDQANSLSESSPVRSAMVQ